MAYSCRLAKLIAGAAIARVLTAPHVARAEATPLLVAGAFVESPKPTVAPLLVLRWPVGDAHIVTVSQVGWASSAAWELTQDRHWQWQSSISVTPLRAHLSHDIYDAEERPASELAFDDTALRIASGERWHSPHVAALVEAVVGKEWLSGVADSVRAPFAKPYGGLRGTVTLENVRAEDPVSTRLDGVRLTTQGAGFAGAHPWVEGRLTLALGQCLGPLAGRLDAQAFYVSFDHPVTDVIIGGSWDALGASGLVGHPLGAFRLTRGASASAGLDVQVLGPVEMGIRASALVGAATVHHGLALVVQGVFSGIHASLGMGAPDGSLGNGNYSRLSIFGTATGALLFLP